MNERPAESHLVLGHARVDDLSLPQLQQEDSVGGAVEVHEARALVDGLAVDLQHHLGLLERRGGGYGQRRFEGGWGDGAGFEGVKAGRVQAGQLA